MAVSDEEAVDLDIPALVDVVGCYGVRYDRRIPKLLREIQRALALIVDRLDKSRDDGSLVSGWAFLEESDLVATARMVSLECNDDGKQVD